jgi:hypothetical protein
MADQLQLRGGTTTEHATFTGALREVTVDTDKDTVVVHDNATTGGYPLLREDLSNLPAGTIDNADINANAAIAGTKISPNFGSQNVVTTGTSTAASLIPTGSSVPTNGVYLPAANSVGISTNGAERARIDSSGRLLVGTSTGQGNSLLQVKGESGSSTGVGSIFLQRGLSIATIGSSGQVNLAKIEFGNQDGAIGAVIQANADAVWGTNDYPGRLTFSTTPPGASSPTERMRIASTGTILFVVTNESVVVNGSANGKFINSSAEMYSSRATTGAASHHLFTNPNGIVGQISTSASTTSYTTTSDYRVKENVVPLSGAIDRLQQLPVHRFNFIADPDTVVDGFIAHEAQAVVPECVTGTKDEVDEDGNPVYQGIDQSKIVPLLTAALQEALAKIETLEARLDAAGIS